MGSLPNFVPLNNLLLCGGRRKNWHDSNNSRTLVKVLKAVVSAEVGITYAVKVSGEVPGKGPKATIDPNRSESDSPVQRTKYEALRDAWNRLEINPLS